MRIQTFRAALLSGVLVLAASGAAGAQAPASPAQQQFQAAQYDQALQSIAEMRGRGAAGLHEAFLAAHVLLRQNQNDRAKDEFRQLVASGDPVWRLTGESSIAMVDNDFDRALDLANQAVNAAQGAPDQLRDFHAYYQLGLVKTRREDWAGAAEAFDRAAQLNPGFAYAHYYAGLAYSRIQRQDQVALHFEQFLKLAPEAPERSAVTSIMRTIRGV
jgi:tetratricopeptide (TPR) repeat protein